MKNNESRVMCKDSACPQALTCQKFDRTPEDKEGKYYFMKSPRGALGCNEYRRIRGGK